MGNLSRLVKYLWPYRYSFGVSVGCAMAVALLWCANISTVGPIVKVLFESNSLQEYVDDQIAEAEATIATESAFLDSGQADTIARQARIQARISTATGRLHTYSNLNRYIMPYVPRDKFNTVAMLVFAVLIGTILKCGFMYAQEILVGAVVNRTANDIRRDCFRSAQKLDLQSVSSEGTPNLLSRMTNDIYQLMTAISVFGTKVIREPLKAAACIGAAFFINWRLTLVAVLLVPMIGVLVARFGRLLKKASHGAMESIAMIYDCISETFDSFKIVQAFGGQRRQQKQFSTANRDFYNHMMKCVRINGLIRSTTEVMAIMIVVVAFTPGAYMVLRNTDTILGVQLAADAMSITELMTFYVLMAGTLDPIRKLSSVFGQIKQGMAGADRAFELIDRESIITEPETALSLNRHAESIRFNDVCFRYATFDGEEPRPEALSNVTLDVRFDEVIAVVGTNGSGKSTLLNLLPRFMDPESGQILIDGTDIRKYRTADLRSQIGLVSQETMLFDDTVYENIRYGNFNADSRAIEEAARKAHAWNFIQDLPEGLNTPVGPGGRKLSGGQRQRVALARAIVRDPAILILDEATSAVDAEGEDLIHRVLKDFSQGRTVFIITHALSETFLDMVDRIVVMDQGRIAAVGEHNELLQSCPVYRRLSQAGLQPRAAA
ncbi:MAG: ABC transporter ATP-binding protein [Fuerstiella sp.]